MGYHSIRMVAETAGSEISDFRLAGKFITFVLVEDVTKVRGFKKINDNTIVFTDGTTVNVGDYVIANFEV